MKKIFFILSLALICINSFGQLQQCPKIIFDYDASGNRIQRHFVITNCNSERGNVVDSTFAMHVNVYPNPTQDKLNVELQNDLLEAESRIELYDLNGKLIYAFQSSSKQIQIDVKPYPAGNYLLKITNGERHTSFNISKF